MAIITLSVSRDGGRTYGDTLPLSVDSQDEPYSRAEWRRLGMGRDFVFKLDVSSPNKLVLLNVWVDVEVSGS